MANVYIKTFGCALNQSDSEMMAGVLETEGHRIVLDESKADVVIINSCTVKDEAENKLYKEIRRHKNRKVIIAGCVVQGEKTLAKTTLKDYSIVGTSQISKIALAVKETLSGNIVVMLDRRKNQINLPRIRKNRRVGIIPISEGCLGTCTYCKTKHARGELFSYPKKDILTEVKKAVKEGATQIWITSQDTGAYGLDIKETLPSLIWDILDIKGDFKVRLGMCNPNFAVLYLDDLKKILLHEKMFRFIHLPLQAGSDNVLKAMNRKYTKNEFMEVYNELKKSIPDLTFATDIIIGFPGETDKDFNESESIIEEVKPDVLNMSRFWKRPNTPAAKMKQLDSKVIKKRSIAMREMFHRISLEKNKRWVGWTGEVIVEEEGKNSSLVARNFAFKPIIIKDEGHGTKDSFYVKITSATTWDLRAEIIKKN